MASVFDATEFNERLFFPRRDASAAPPGAVDLHVEVDGARLHLRRHRRLPGAPTVLLFHGNGEVVADYDASAERFAACGADLAVAEFRGYGQSTGAPSLRHAIGDAPSVLEALEREGATRIIVMGRSLGSACAAELYARADQALVACVWESGFADLDALIRRRGMAPPPRLPPEDLEVFDPIPKMRRGVRPLLVLHGAGDDLIAPSEAERIFEAAGADKKELVFVPERGHNDLSLDPVYWDALGAFIRALPASPPAG